ncbi:MAG: hypothetical protein ACK5Z2_07780 [Bacteroidota bacterium]
MTSDFLENRTVYRKEKLYSYRYFWILFFVLTLLIAPVNSVLLPMLGYVIGEETDLYQEIYYRFYFGYLDGYVHIGLLVAIPFILGSSYLFRQLQLVLLPDQRPVGFLLFRPMKLIDLLEALNAGESDSSFRITSFRNFWNVFFVIVQPVYLLLLTFPIVKKLYIAGYSYELLDSVSSLIKIGASFSWVIILYRIFSLFEPHQQSPEFLHERYEITNGEERKLITGKITKLRTIELRHIIDQLLIAILIAYLFLGFIYPFALSEQLKIFASNELLQKGCVFSGVFLSLLTLYYVNRLTKAVSVFTPYTTPLIIANLVLFFIPFISWIWRIGLFVLLRKNWNDAMDENGFHPRLKLPVGKTIAFAIFFLLFSFYSSGYFIDFLGLIKLQWTADLHYNVYYKLNHFQLISLHVFVMLLVSYSLTVEKHSKQAADELEASYTNL